MVRVRDVPGGQDFRLYRGHGGGARAVAFSSDGLRQASGSNDGPVKV